MAQHIFSEKLTYTDVNCDLLLSSETRRAILSQPWSQWQSPFSLGITLHVHISSGNSSSIALTNIFLPNPNTMPLLKNMIFNAQCMTILEPTTREGCKEAPALSREKRDKGITLKKYTGKISLTSRGHHKWLPLPFVPWLQPLPPTPSLPQPPLPLPLLLHHYCYCYCNCYYYHYYDYCNYHYYFFTLPSLQWGMCTLVSVSLSILKFASPNFTVFWSTGKQFVSVVIWGTSCHAYFWLI